MKIFSSFMHPLTLLLVSLFAVIQTSWSVEIKTAENLLRDILLQNPAGVTHTNPSSSIFPLNTKLVDERISNIIAENVLHFGHSLGLELASLDPHAMKSEIFSPLSIMAALSLLTLGAKGKSYQELKQLLGLDSDSELIKNPSKYHEEFGLMLNDLQNPNVRVGGVNKRPNANWRFTKLKSAPVRSTGRNQSPVEHIIKVANGLFVQSGYTLNPDYSKIVQSIYQSELTQLDFQRRKAEARDHINAWVNKTSFGKIPQIITGDLEETTNVILASVLYLKAFWETSFFPRATTEDNFYPDGIHNPPIKVQMMPTGGVFPFYSSQEYNCRIIGLPYKGNETTMYVIQPNNSSREKLRELQHILNARRINELIDKMERKTTVMVFPKMHFTRSLTLKTILKNMDVRDIFVNGKSDLSLIGGGSIKNHVGSAPAKFAPTRVAVSFESIYREVPNYQKLQFADRFEEPALLFSSRFGEISESNNEITVAPEEIETTEMPSMINKTTTGTKKEKREIPMHRDALTEALSNLESDRLKTDYHRADLYVDEIVHKVDFSVDEQGTEAAAATLTYLHRSGTDVVFRGDTPFLIIIRHDPTKLPLFYGIINKPEL